MKMKLFLLVLFFATLSFSTAILNYDNKTWSTDDIITELNTVVPNKSYFFHDPYNETTTWKDLIVRDYYKYLTDEYSKNLYIILVYDISLDEINTTQIIDSYTYPYSGMSSNSIFVIEGFKTKKWAFGLGSNSTIPSEYLEDLITVINEDDYSATYHKYRNLIAGIRGGYITPENYWTPKTLSDIFLKSCNQSKYKFYDPLYTVELDEDTKLEHYFTQALTEDVQIYIIVVNKLNSLYTNSTSNTTAFLSQLSSYLSEGIDVNNSAIGLYAVWDKKFDMIIGSGLGGNLTEEEYIDFMKGVCIWKSLTNSYQNFLRSCRYYLVGNRKGWSGLIFAGYLKDDSSLTAGDYYLHYFPKNKEEEEEDILLTSGIMRNFNLDLKLHSLCILLEKLYKNQSISQFLTDFFNEYKSNSTGFTKENTLSIVFLNDKSSQDIIIGSDFSSILPSANITHAKDKASPYIKNGSYLLGFKASLKSIRYDVFLSKSLYIGKNMGYYFNDVIGKQQYYFLQQTKSLNEDELYSSLNIYFEGLLKNKVHLFFFTMDRIDTTVHDNLTSFANQLKDTLGDSRGVLHEFCYNLVIVVFNKLAKEFAISRSYSYVTELSEDVMKKLIASIPPKDEINSYKNMAKYIRYYVIFQGKDWTSDNILDYINDFEDVSTCKNYIMMNPNLRLNEEDNNILKIYLNDLNDKNVHIYTFILKMKDDIEEDKLLNSLIELFKSKFQADEENSIFMIYYFKNRENYPYFYKIGSKLLDKLSDSTLKNIINNSVLKYPESEYDVFRNIFLNIRTIFSSEEDKWTGESLADFYNKKYPALLNENYDLFDYYLKIESKMEKEIKIKLQELSIDHKINAFIFIINSISSSTTLDEVTNTLLTKINDDHIKDRKNTLIMSYLTNSNNQISIKEGDEIKYVITNNFINNITETASKKVSIDESIIYMLNELIEQGKVNRKFTPTELKSIFVEKYKNNDYLVYDPQRNFNTNQIDNLNNILNLITKNYTYVFSFIMAQLGDINSNEYMTNDKLKDYIKNLAHDFPCPKPIKDNNQIYFVYISSTNQLAYYVNNNNELSKKVLEISEKSTEYFNKGINEGFDYLFNEIQKYVKIKKFKKNSFPWMLVSIVLLFVVFVCVVIIFMMRVFKKTASHSVNLEKQSAKVEPLGDNLI